MPNEKAIVTFDISILKYFKNFIQNKNNLSLGPKLTFLGNF